MQNYFARPINNTALPLLQSNKFIAKVNYFWTHCQFFIYYYFFLIHIFLNICISTLSSSSIVVALLLILLLWLILLVNVMYLPFILQVLCKLFVFVVQRPSCISNSSWIIFRACGINSQQAGKHTCTCVCVRTRSYNLALTTNTV